MTLDGKSAVKSKPTRISLISDLLHNKNELRARGTGQAIHTVFVIRGPFFARSETSGDGRLHLEGWATEVDRTYDGAESVQPRFVAYWFWNSSKHLAYSRVLRIEGTESASIDLGGFAQHRLETEIPSYSSFNLMALEYRGSKFLFGMTREDLSGKKGFVRSF